MFKKRFDHLIIRFTENGDEHDHERFLFCEGLSGEMTNFISDIILVLSSKNCPYFNIN